jgi:hypothetical protein
MGGESAAAWTAFLEDMTRRGLRAPEFVTACGAPGLDAALSALWPDAPVQRCTVHKHRNPASSPGQALLAHAPRRLHDEPTGDRRDMIRADTAAEVEAPRKAFLRKWRPKCRAVADSLEGEGGPWPRCGRVSPPNGDRLSTPDRVRGRLLTRLLECAPGAGQRIARRSGQGPGG